MIESGNHTFSYDDFNVSNGIELSIESLRHYFPKEKRFTLPDYEVVDFLPDLLIAIITCCKKDSEKTLIFKIGSKEETCLDGAAGIFVRRVWTSGKQLLIWTYHNSSSDRSSSLKKITIDVNSLNDSVLETLLT
jgi:hypothetical protein